MIKEQSEELEGERTSNKMKFVKTWYNGQMSAYIPGSSLKGVLRSHCERIARTLGARCCNPFLNKDEDLSNSEFFCGKRIECQKKLEETLTVPWHWIPITIIPITIISMAGSFLYLFIEVNHIIKDKDEAFWRVATVLALGLIESLTVGMIISDLFDRFFCEIAEIGKNFPCWESPPYQLEGLLGKVYPPVITLFAPLALFIGIFVQILWKEKPITQPL